MNGSPLSVMMVRARFELRKNVEEIQKQSGLPAYLLTGILSEIIAELRAQEKEELAILYLQQQKEDDDNAERKSVD